MLFEKGLHFFVEIQPILRIVEAMAFVHFHQVFDGLAVGLERTDDLLRFLVVHSGIVVALGDEERHFDLVHREKRRARAEQFLVNFRIAKPLIHQLAKGFPIWRDGVHEGEQVGQPHIVHATGEDLRPKRQRRQGGVAALAPPIDAEPLLVRDALPHDPIRTIDQVVEHLATPLAVARVQELLPVPGRAAVVDICSTAKPRFAGNCTSGS